MRSNMLIRSAPLHPALTRNLGAAVAVIWASAAARYRAVLKMMEEEHKNGSLRACTLSQSL